MFLSIAVAIAVAVAVDVSVAVEVIAALLLPGATVVATAGRGVVEVVVVIVPLTP